MLICKYKISDGYLQLSYVYEYYTYNNMISGIGFAAS